MNTLNTKLLIAVFACLGLFTLQANAATRHVDCDAGETLSSALETAKGSAALLEIVVSGTCDENIFIRRDAVWIAGDPYAWINGTISVFSANNININNVAISGPGSGVIVSGTGRTSLRWVHMEGNTGHSLVVRRDGFVWLRDSEIVGNCEPIGNPECSDGVTVSNASLDVMRSSIFNNRNGIIADVGSNVILRGTRTRSMEIYNNSVVGVQVALHSVVDLAGDTRVYGNGVDGRNGLYALQDSAIRISTPNVTVTDYIFCEDWESSLAIRPEFPPVETNCTGF